MNKYLIIFGVLLTAGCSSVRTQTASTNWPLHSLVLFEETKLTPPKGLVFQASGLTLDASGRLLTVHDRQSVVYQIGLAAATNESPLIAWNRHFTEFVRDQRGRQDDTRFDCEGIAVDERGDIYLCEESERRVLRCDPVTGAVQALEIDWAPVRSFFNGIDDNASFEGIAVAGGRLYLANERNDPVIVVVDLKTEKVVDHFVVYARTRSFLGMHYSGLAIHGGRLFVLLRQHRVILEVDLQTQGVLAEYDYRAAEDALGYTKTLPVGVMEGLAVDDDFFWLVTDNNGKPRRGTKDARPTLLKFRRPLSER